MEDGCKLDVYYKTRMLKLRRTVEETLSEVFPHTVGDKLIKGLCGKADVEPQQGEVASGALSLQGSQHLGVG